MKKAPLYILLFLATSGFWLGCEQNGKPTPQLEVEKSTLFRSLSPKRTGINFSNNIDDKNELTFINYSYIYNGGGVAAGDLNNDSLPDLILTGNQVKTKVYLNKGNFKFEDITQKTGIDNGDGWTTGVTLADVNGDGWLDVYLCKAGLNPDLRQNRLFINQGNLLFEEAATAYKLNNDQCSIHANFFDYDNDGDLDAYLLNHPDDFSLTTELFAYGDTSRHNNGADRLMRNDGNTFTDITRQAGILSNFAYGLSVSTSDVNNDGYLDIFVGNDYFSDDLLYINDPSGVFSEQSGKYLRKISLFTMGSDFADLNNDGLPELMTVDMMPEDHFRIKNNLLNIPQVAYNIVHKSFGNKQYMRNMLHMANPSGAYSEVSQYAGVARTDWSWSVLLQDFDNDGWNDIHITNGTKRDLHDLDFMQIMEKVDSENGFRHSEQELIEKMPSTLLPNYMYRNKGNMQFEDITKQWGIYARTATGGSAFADFDRDGDLDLVLNNADTTAFVYENRHAQQPNANWLQIKLQGTGKNLCGIGARATIYYNNGKRQTKELSTTHGYQSTSQYLLHFGLGNAQKVDSLEILWLGKQRQIVEHLGINQVHYIKQAAVSSPMPDVAKAAATAQALLSPDAAKGLTFKHKESNFDDFRRDWVLPHMLSREGPGIAVADVNDDGTDDVYVGGAAGQIGQLFLQQKNGTFIQKKIPGNKAEFEEMGVLLADLNNDNAPDLYLTSGSNEFREGSPGQNDRLFLNDGKGNFTIDETILQPNGGNSSCIVAHDYDKDGDLDIFVGGGVVSERYPFAHSSRLLVNHNGKLIDMTAKLALGLNTIGMATAAIWTDYDNDGFFDLFVVGEWMPPTLFKNKGNGILKNITTNLGNAAQSGWWNAIIGGDLDNDGDTDYVLANHGLNCHLKALMEEPLSVCAGDFDNNGSLDPILFHYLAGEQGAFVDRMVFCKKMPEYFNKYHTFKSYASSGFDDMFTPEQLADAKVLKATQLASGCLINEGNGKFTWQALSYQAQLAPLYGILLHDFDEDGTLDLLLTGNSYGNFYSLGTYDDFNGLLLKGDGTGNFTPLLSNESGFYNAKDGKSLALLHSAATGKPVVLAANNNDALRTFTCNKPLGDEKAIKVRENETHALLHFKDGKTQKKEFYKGGGYLSQSGGWLYLNENLVSKAEIFDASGGKRTLDALITN